MLSTFVAEKHIISTFLYHHIISLAPPRANFRRSTGWRGMWRRERDGYIHCIHDFRTITQHKPTHCKWMQANASVMLNNLPKRQQKQSHSHKHTIHICMHRHTHTHTQAPTHGRKREWEMEYKKKRRTSTVLHCKMCIVHSVEVASRANSKQNGTKDIKRITERQYTDNEKQNN